MKKHRNDKADLWKLLNERTCIMGILNVTPDSFYDGDRYSDPDNALAHIHSMATAGADIIDVGGQSTRPGAVLISEQEEMDRVLPVISKAAKEISITLSVDTFQSKVAEEALKIGVDIINDITGLKHDERMATVIAEYNAGCIVMHIKGTPKNMQDDPEYSDLIGEITDYLRGSIDIAEKFGIDPNKIIVDPGIGFGKTAEHNLTIIKYLGRFKVLKKPILLGTSRKTFIGKVVNKEPDKRLIGTAVANAAAIMNGANIIRVHDVDVMKEVALVTDAILNERLR